MKKIVCLLGIAGLMAGAAQAAVFTWDGDLDGNWATGTNWVGGVQPVNGTDTDVVIAGTANITNQFIRNHRQIRSLTFDGSNDGATSVSLESHTGANRDLRMDGGAGNASITVASGSTGDKTIGITTGGQGEIEMFTDLDITHNGDDRLLIRSQIRDDSTANNVTIAGAGEYLILGVSTYLGNTVITADNVLYANNSGLAFVIGADGVNNAMLGTGTVEIKSDFTLDLSGASTTEGDSWTLVDVDNLNESFHAQFAVAGFTQDANVWTGTAANGAEYEFVESTGVLSVIPEPAAMAIVVVFGGGMLFIRRLFL